MPRKKKAVSRSSPKKATKKKPVKKKTSKLRDRYKKLKGRKRGNNLVSPLWDLEKDGVSFSMLSKFLGCPERFRLATVEGWTSRYLSVPLEFGSIFHNYLEFLQDGGSPNKLFEMGEQYKKNRLTDKTNAISPKGAEDLEVVLGLAEVTAIHYIQYWSETPTYQNKNKDVFDNQLKYTYQEETFAVQHRLPNGRDITLRGRWDAGLIHPFTNRTVLKENKTKERIDEVALIDGLKKDLQTQFYLYTMSLHEGRKPGHILYDVIRRSGMRRRQTESIKDFVDRVEEDIESRPEYYYMRWTVDLEADDIQNFVDRSLNPLLMLIWDWWQSVKHNPFDPWTTKDGSPNYKHYEKPFGIYDSSMFGSGKGDFWEILYDGRYDSYYQRDVAFPELVD